jgi:hypothetical protein
MSENAGDAFVNRRYRSLKVPRQWKESSAQHPRYPARPMFQFCKPVETFHKAEDTQSNAMELKPGAVTDPDGLR